MRKPEIYLDNSATTQPCEACVEATIHCMRECYHNPSALYGQAVAAERELRTAREVVASSVGGAESRVFFTSGGTESDNLAILGTLGNLRDPGEVLYSAAEHPAVKNACLAAEARLGAKAREIPLNARGTLDLAALETMLSEQTKLLCVMQVCNETGAMMPLDEVVALRDRLAPGAAIHVDGVQGYLRVPFSFRKLSVQSYAISAHKIHGPKGVGALVLAEGHKIQPQMVGGGQQEGIRSGTENTVGILGLTAAIGDYPATETAAQTLADLKRTAAEQLLNTVPGLRILGPEPGTADSAPHILYVALPPVRAETMVHALEADGVLVGTGSACSSRKHKRSEVLTAMGVPPAVIDSSIRLSFSLRNTQDEVRYAAQRMAAHYAILSKFTRR